MFAACTGDRGPILRFAHDGWSLNPVVRNTRARKPPLGGVRIGALSLDVGLSSPMVCSLGAVSHCLDCSDCAPSNAHRCVVRPSSGKFGVASLPEL